MNSQASQPGGNNSFAQANVKTSFSQRAFNYFKGTTQTFTNIEVAPGTYNKNLKMFMNQTDDGFGDAGQKGLPKGLNDKRNKHQLFVSSIYNKVVMLHLSP